MSATKPHTVYGYRITAPEDEHSLQFIHDICSMNDIMEDSIKVHYMVYHRNDTNVHAVQLIIGFIPDNDLKKNIHYFENLNDFITDNPMLDGVTIESSPAFYTGFEWNDDMLSETSLTSNDVSSSEDSDDVSSSEDSDDVSSSEDSDDVSSSEDSNDVSASEASDDDASDEDDENENKKNNDDQSLTYYVSKYYI